MLRILISILLVVLEACSGLGSAKTYIPTSPPEMKTAAASLMGRDVNNRLPAPDANSIPRIEIPVSHGRAPLIGERAVEVTRSDIKSGAYIAFTSQVPPTRYFDILGRADCDNWVYLQLMNTEMLINRPKYYGGGEYTGDKAAFKCAGIFHQNYRDNSDPRLIGSDGVIFDVESAVFTDTAGWFIQNRKLHMDGWAIKFVNPSIETIRSRLEQPPVTPVDLLQLRAAAYWVEVNHVSALADSLRSLLLLKTPRDVIFSWRPTDRYILHALAAVEDESSPDDVFRAILEAGVYPMLRQGHQSSEGVSATGDAPYLAANVMICRDQPGTKETFRRVLLGATIRQHKLAAAKALIHIGDTNFVRKELRDGNLGDAC